MTERLEGMRQHAEDLMTGEWPDYALKKMLANFTYVLFSCRCIGPVVFMIAILKSRKCYSRC